MRLEFNEKQQAYHFYEKPESEATPEWNLIGHFPADRLSEVNKSIQDNWEHMVGIPLTKDDVIFGFVTLMMRLDGDTTSKLILVD